MASILRKPGAPVNSIPDFRPPAGAHSNRGPIESSATPTALRAAVSVNAEAHARDHAPVIAGTRAGGATSLRAIAGELNARGMQTRRGGRWHVSNTGNLLERLGCLSARGNGIRL